MVSTKELFTDAQCKAITETIALAEKQTSGEIRLYIENNFAGELLDRAAFIFEELGMHKTHERNGVLFYLAIKSRQFAIIGDVGINAIVGPAFWNEIKDLMAASFKSGDFVKGLTEGISRAGEALRTHFPYSDDDVNELPDDIVFGGEDA